MNMTGKGGFIVKKWLALVVSVLICLQLCACELPQEPTEPTEQTGIYTDVLTEEMANEIEQAWLRENKHGLQWYLTDDGEVIPDGVRYYGTYNGYSILFVEGNLTQISSTTIASRVFRWGTGAVMLYAFKDGQLQELQTVYDCGLLTDEDIGVIWQRHREQFDANHNWDYNMGQ